MVNNLTNFQKVHILDPAQYPMGSNVVDNTRSVGVYNADAGDGVISEAKVKQSIKLIYKHASERENSKLWEAFNPTSKA